LTASYLMFSRKRYIKSVVNQNNFIVPAHDLRV
jgi:hypothetical protein